MSAFVSALVEALAWALLDFVWQGLLVGWGAALLLALLRRARPQARYAVACAALLLCAALPLAGTVQRLMDAQAAATSMLPLALADADSPLRTDAAPAVALARVAGWEQALQSQLPLVILSWSCGAGLLALRMMLGLAWVRRRSRPGQYRVDAAWQARVDQLARQLGIARRVTLGLVDDLASPVTAGWWRPVVLVPASLVTGMPPQLLEALLAHELAHVRRFDYLVNLIQSAIEILLFYHPTVWWLSNRIRIEREQIADDVAASTLGEPRRLALALSELDLFQLSTPQLAHAAHGGNLMSRIKRLVRPESEPLNWKLAVPILGLALSAAFYSHTDTAHAAASPAQAAGQAPAAPAQPAVQASPAHPAAKTVHRTHGKSADNAYALVSGTDRGANMSGGSQDWKEVEAVKRAIDGDFLWFRDGGKTWVVQDPAVLARASAAWEPVDRLGKQMEAYGAEMEKHGDRMDALGKEMEKAADSFKPDEGKVREFERKMEELSRQMAALGGKMDTASDEEQDRIGREMGRIGKQMDELGRKFEQEQNAQGRRLARASMEEIGRRMNEAGKPMNELGKKMDALGKQMEQESRAAEKIVRELIRDAVARGLARPAPAQG